MELIPKHKLFIDHYILNGQNATESYQQIYGIEKREFAKNLGWKVLQRPEVKEYLERQRNTLQKKHNISKDEMIEELYQVIKECKDGDITDKQNWLRAIDLINKIAGNYESKPNQNLKQINYNISFGGGQKSIGKGLGLDDNKLDDYEEI